MTKIVTWVTTWVNSFPNEFIYEGTWMIKQGMLWAWLPCDWQTATIACPQVFSQIQSEHPHQLHLNIQMQSLLAPENPDSDGHKAKLELQNGGPQNNGWRHGSFKLYLRLICLQSTSEAQILDFSHSNSLVCLELWRLLSVKKTPTNNPCFGFYICFWLNTGNTIISEL